MLLNWGSFANKKAAWNMTKKTGRGICTGVTSTMKTTGWLMNTGKNLTDSAVDIGEGLLTGKEDMVGKGLQGLNGSWEDCNRKIKNGINSLSNKGFSITNTGSDVRIETDSDLYNYKGEGLNLKVGAKDSEKNSHNELEINNTMKSMNYLVEEKKEMLDRQEKYTKPADGGVAAQIDFNSKEKEKIQNFKDRVIENYKSKWNKIVKQNTSKFENIKTQNGFIIVDKEMNTELQRTKKIITLLKNNEGNVMNMIQNEIDTFTDMATNSYLETSEGTNVIDFLFRLKNTLETHIQKKFERALFDIDYLS